jgi:phytoene dehydrogenase-like protein
MEWEAVDDRPLVVYHEPLWQDDTERMTYEAACEADRPRDTDTLEGYLARISAAVEGKYKGILPKMRRPGLSRVDRERQLAKLRGQMPSRMELL